MFIRQGRSYMMRNGRAVAINDNTEGTRCMLADGDLEDNSVCCVQQPAPIGSGG